MVTLIKRNYDGGTVQIGRGTDRGYVFVRDKAGTKELHVFTTQRAHALGLTRPTPRRIVRRQHNPFAFTMPRFRF